MDGARIVNVITPPSVEPVTLTEAKAHLRVDFDDDDDLISALITAARAMCETRTRRPFITTSFELVLDQFPFGGGYYNRTIRQQPSALNWLPTNTGIIELPRGGVTSVDAIRYLDSNGNVNTLDPSIYTFTPGTPARVAPSYGHIWPLTYLQISSVFVDFTGGYGSDPSYVPSGIKVGIKLLVGHLYQNREAVTEGSMSELPIGVDAVLDPYCYGSYQ